MKHTIIINISFNERDYINGLNTTKEWIDYRMNIFMNYTCQSLKKQTNQNFLALIKYRKDTEDLIFDALSHYDPLPENIQFIDYKIVRQKIISIIKDKVEEDVFIGRIDSDDLYHEDYIEILHQFNPKAETKFLVNINGYIYDLNEKKLGYFQYGRYDTTPFYVSIYRNEDYTHGAPTVKTPYEVIDGNHFLITYHKKNTLTQFQSNPRIKYLIENEQDKQLILSKFVNRSEDNG